MKTYLIFSPAYRGNGRRGTYYSIAICEDNGDFVKIIGDHCRQWIGTKFFYEDKKNVHEIVGLSFSDEDRLINIREIDVDMDALEKWEKLYNEGQLALNEWEDKRKKAKANNQKKYEEWCKNNQYPLTVEWYDFLKSIHINRNENY